MARRCSSYCTVKESQMPNHLRKLQSNKVQWEKVFSLRNLTFHTFNTYAKRRVGYFFIERKTLIKLNDIALFEIG